MTELRINGGASVHRAWSDAGTEFLACFQYETDAKDFAEAKLAEDAARGWEGSFYIVSNHHDGSLLIMRHKPALVKEAA